MVNSRGSCPNQGSLLPVLHLREQRPFRRFRRRFRLLCCPSHSSLADEMRQCFAIVQILCRWFILADRPTTFHPHLFHGVEQSALHLRNNYVGDRILTRRRYQISVLSTVIPRLNECLFAGKISIAVLLCVSRSGIEYSCRRKGRNHHVKLLFQLINSHMERDYLIHTYSAFSFLPNRRYRTVFENFETLHL